MDRRIANAAMLCVFSVQLRNLFFDNFSSLCCYLWWFCVPDTSFIYHFVFRCGLIFDKNMMNVVNEDEEIY